MHWLWLIVIMMVAAVAVGPSVARGALRSAAVKRRAAYLMRGRGRLSPREFATRFFPAHQQPVAEGIHELLDRALIMDSAKVHPSDLLIGDLGLCKVDGLDAHHLSADCEERFGIAVLSLFATQDPTVRQLIEYVAQAAEQPGAEPSKDLSSRSRTSNPLFKKPGDPASESHF
jgi:acyl carrier protein